MSLHSYVRMGAVDALRRNAPSEPDRPDLGGSDCCSAPRMGGGHDRHAMADHVKSSGIIAVLLDGPKYDRAYAANLSWCGIGDGEPHYADSL